MAHLCSKHSGALRQEDQIEGQAGLCGENLSEPVLRLGSIRGSDAAATFSDQVCIWLTD